MDRLAIFILFCSVHTHIRNKTKLKMANQETKARASITNIHYDCLEPIFKFLDLQNLLHVAKTCEQLQIAAAIYYRRVYGKRVVWVWNYILCKSDWCRQLRVLLAIFTMLTIYDLNQASEWPTQIHWTFVGLCIQECMKPIKVKWHISYECF